MKSSTRVRGLLLIASALFLSSPSFAQDSTKLTIDHSKIAGWNFILSNGNPSHLDIKHVGLKILTPGITFLEASTTGAASDWIATSPVGTAEDTASYDNPSTWLRWPNSIGNFGFSLDIPYAAYDRPVQIQWKTTFTGVLTAGTWTVTPTLFQSYTSLDSVSLTSSTLPNGDPAFDFNVKSRNSPSFAIKALSFQILDVTRGQIRPYDVKAPVGWTLDSVRPYVAYFHTDGSGIPTGKNLSGFVLGIRTDAQPKIFPFVWRAYATPVLADSGSFIDRDTISSGSITAGATSIASNGDSVKVSNTSTLCSFNAVVSNYHISNNQPPSPIARLILNSATAGVTFKSANPPSDWGKSISVDGRSITYASSDDVFALPSGRTGSFGASVDNPSGGNFTINWLAIGTALDTIDAGSFVDSCAVQTPTPDIVTLTALGQCNYKFAVQNAHGPTASSLHAISLSIAPADGKFESTGSSSNPKWALSQAGLPQSVYFYDTAQNNGAELPNGQSQDFTFSIIPNASGAQVPIQWATYDIPNATNPVSRGTLNATCSATKCDSVRSLFGDCVDTLIVANNRGTGKAVNKIVVTALDGQKVASAFAVVPWTHDVSPDEMKAVFTAPTGINDGLQAAFMVNFKGPNSTFRFDIATTDVDNVGCIKQETMTCTPSGVAPTEALRTLGLSVAPNPFSGRTEVTFTLADRERTNLVLLDVLGRIQQTVLDASLDMGSHSIGVDGSALRPGTYYLRLETSAGRVTKKLVVNK